MVKGIFLDQFVLMMVEKMVEVVFIFFVQVENGLIVKIFFWFCSLFKVVELVLVFIFVKKLCEGCNDGCCECGEGCGDNCCGGCNGNQECSECGECLECVNWIECNVEKVFCEELIVVIGECQECCLCGECKECCEW